MADHFGEAWNPADCGGSCDVCDPSGVAERVGAAAEVAGAAMAAVDLAAGQDCKLTGLKLVNSLLGRGEAKFRSGSSR